MKRLSVEAQSHREQKILREANKELERFETEIESYLEDVEEEEDVEEDQKLPSELVNTNHESVGGDSSFIHTPSSTVSPAMPISSLPQRVHQQPRSTASSSSSQSDSGSERKKEQRNQTLST
jgi:predicted ribosome quality control (RQC) complex YloA/Tae2 family protein